MRRIPEFDTALEAKEERLDYHARNAYETSISTVLYDEHDLDVLNVAEIPFPDRLDPFFQTFLKCGVKGFTVTARDTSLIDFITCAQEYGYEVVGAKKIPTTKGQRVPMVPYSLYLNALQFVKR